MPKYRVKVAREVIELDLYEVEAASHSEVYQQFERSADWEFIDEYVESRENDSYVFDIEEVDEDA